MNKQLYILCPVCEKHKFPIWEDNGTCICPHCGWSHDSYGENNPTQITGPNDLSLNDFKLRYNYYMEQNPQYHWSTNLFPDIPQIEKNKWPICGWEDDGFQLNNPNHDGGANEISLNQYREQYSEKLKQEPKYRWDKHN